MCISKDSYQMTPFPKWCGPLGIKLAPAFQITDIPPMTHYCICVLVTFPLQVRIFVFLKKGRAYSYLFILQITMVLSERQSTFLTYVCLLLVYSCMYVSLFACLFMFIYIFNP